MVRPMSRGLETRVVTPSIVPGPQCSAGRPWCRFRRGPASRPGRARPPVASRRSLGDPGLVQLLDCEGVVAVHGQLLLPDTHQDPAKAPTAASGACLISPIAPSRKASTSAPCHRWSPANTSWTSASRARRAARRAPRATPRSGRGRIDGKMGSSVPVSTSSGRGATSAATSRCSSAPSCPGSTCEPHMFHGTVCAAATTRGSRTRSRPRTRSSSAARNSVHVPPYESPAARDAVGSTSGCAASTSSARCRSQRLRCERHDAGHRGAHEVPVAVVLVVGHPVGALAEAAQVGREHDVARASRARARTSSPSSCSRRSTPHMQRLARTVAVDREHRRSGLARSCGTSRYAGTDIVASVSNTTRSRRYVPQSTDLGRSRGRAAPARARARASRRAAPRTRAAPRLELRRDRRAGTGSASTTVSSCSRQYAQLEKLRACGVTRSRRAPSRGRPRGGAGTRASPTRPGSGRGWSRTRGPRLRRSTTRAGSRTPAAARRAPSRSSSPSRTRSSTCASGRRSRNWYTSSCHCHSAPRCAHAGCVGSSTSAVNVCVHGWPSKRAPTSAPYSSQP